MITFAVCLYQGEDVPLHSKGIFTPEWANWLYRGISRNITVPWRLVCFVDQHYDFTEPIETLPIVLPYRNMFCLLEPFREDMGRVIFMGLDTIITGNLDALTAYDGPFAMLRDPNNRAIGCSGVMAYPYTPAIWGAITEAHQAGGLNHRMFGHLSDMAFLNTVPHAYLDDHQAGQGIYSYKVHIKRNPALLKTARIIYFHGLEKPHELPHLDWVRKYWGPPVPVSQREDTTMAQAPKKTDEKPFAAKDWKAEDASKPKVKGSAREVEIGRLDEQIKELEAEGNQPTKLEDLRSLIDKYRAQTDEQFDAARQPK